MTIVPKFISNIYFLFHLACIDLTAKKCPYIHIIFTATKPCGYFGWYGKMVYGSTSGLDRNVSCAYYVCFLGVEDNSCDNNDNDNNNSRTIILPCN